MRADYGDVRQVKSCAGGSQNSNRARKSCPQELAGKSCSHAARKRGILAIPPPPKSCMPPRSSQLKSKHQSSTPRLLSRVPWLLPLAVLLPVAILYAASPQPRPPAHSTDLSRELELPREPPVDLLSVPNSGFPCAVDDVLEAKCRRCHTRPMRHGAPFPLLTWDDTRLFVRADAQVYLQLDRVITTGTMPFRIPANPPVEPLTADEKWVLLDWVRRGAPRGTCP